MSRLSPTLLVLALAVALSAATPVAAQQITTSHGVRTLTRPDPKAPEAQLRRYESSAENVVLELLQDIAAIEAEHGSAAGDAETLAEKVKKANADYERAKTAFDAMDQQYRDDLSAFQQRQSRLEADAQQQRSQAAVLEALPSAQRDYAEVTRLNDWASKISSERQAIQNDQGRLLADHDRVETERAKLAQQRVDSENKLKAVRGNTIGQLGTAAKRSDAAYSQLSIAVAYLRGVREQLSHVASIRLGRSDVLDQATVKLQAYQARTSATQK